MKLCEVFEIARGPTLPDDWVYLPKDEEWTLDTEATLVDMENEDPDDCHVPLIAIRKNLIETLNFDLIQDVVRWADHLASSKNPAACLDVFQYYCRFDAFPEKLGASNPPSAEAIAERLDREFYDGLGSVNEERKCRKEACSRGIVKFSAFCRVHHFESVKKKSSPFAH